LYFAQHHWSKYRHVNFTLWRRLKQIF